MNPNREQNQAHSGLTIQPKQTSNSKMVNNGKSIKSRPITNRKGRKDFSGDSKNTTTTDEKYQHLLNLLHDMGKIAVAYSGGVDSTFLLAAAKQASVAKLIALTMKRPYFAQWELEEATNLVKKLGIPHKIIELPVDDKMSFNPPDRCYLCKSSTFKRFREEMDQLGFDTLLDGTNADDIQEYRPGLRAVKEFKVRSPLQETGFTKAEIRQKSRELGLPEWDKPSNTCLVTRIPYHTDISNNDLRMIEKAELFLMKEGFRLVRVRKYDDHARIEVDPGMVDELLKKDKMNHISSYLGTLGFKNVSVDLEGYKTGNLDKTILKNTNN
ncbi:MAG: ATP-dependent sacrificial sulfur transferase LarE [Balneolales bacterium]